LDVSGSARYGKSKRQYSIVTWADEIAGLIDQLKLDAAVIVGHSMGTVIVQKFAAKYPQKTKAIILAGALVELGPPGKEAFTKRAETVEKEGMIGVAVTVLGGAVSAGTGGREPAR